MPPPAALLDANVLYPAGLRDLCAPLWSADIHEEWMRSLLADRPDIPAGVLERTRAIMDEHFPDATVTGYAALAASLDLPDPGDAHTAGGRNPARPLSFMPEHPLRQARGRLLCHARARSGPLFIPGRREAASRTSHRPLPLIPLGRPPTLSSTGHLGAADHGRRHGVRGLSGRG